MTFSRNLKAILLLFLLLFIKSTKPNGASFRISASVGFSELFFTESGFQKKPGLSYKLSMDYWFGDHFGLGFEFGFLNFFGYKYMDWDINSDEFHLFLLPYIKIGLLSGTNWRLSFDTGLGFNEVQYNSESSRGVREILIKFGLVWSYKISKHFETGIIFDSKCKLAAFSEEADATPNAGILSLSISPLLGYVF